MSEKVKCPESNQLNTIVSLCKEYDVKFEYEYNWNIDAIECKATKKSGVNCKFTIGVKSPIEQMIEFLNYNK